jgi:hypothetical protein
MKMDTEIIFWKAIELEPGCEMVLSFTTREARNAAANSLKIRRRLMFQEYNLFEAEYLSIEEDEDPHGAYLIRIMRNFNRRACA